MEFSRGCEPADCVEKHSKAAERPRRAIRPFSAAAPRLLRRFAALTAGLHPRLNSPRRSAAVIASPNICPPEAGRWPRKPKREEGHASTFLDCEHEAPPGKPEASSSRPIARVISQRILGVTLVVLSCAIHSAHAGDNPPDRAPEIAGIWLGTLEAGGERVRVVIKISKNAAGNLAGSMDSPDRGRRDLHVEKIDFQDGHLRVEAVGDRVFIGEYQPDRQEFVGQWQQEGARLPLTLSRVDRAPEFDVPRAGGLYVAAAVTSLLALLVMGRFILMQAPRAEWRFLALVMAVHLPMCAIAFHWVRLPIKAWLVGVLGTESRTFAFLDTCFAPLTEEPAKLWLLLFPWFVARLRKENAPRIAMAIGLGFGIGEAWLLVGLLRHDPQIARIPWYMFAALGGFIVERFMVCIFHSAFTATALWLFPRAPLRGILCAMGLHYLGNFPIALMAWNVGGLGHAVWSVLAQTWLILYFASMLALLGHFFKSADPAGWRGWRHYIAGQAKCPECGLIYERPWIAANLGTRRYERCPGCRRWHFTTKWQEEKPPPSIAPVGGPS